MCVLVLQVQTLQLHSSWNVLENSFASNDVTSCLMHTHADVIFSILQLLGMAFSMTLYQQIHRAGKKYDA